MPPAPATPVPGALLTGQSYTLIVERIQADACKADGSPWDAADAADLAYSIRSQGDQIASSLVRQDSADGIFLADPAILQTADCLQNPRLLELIHLPGPLPSFSFHAGRMISIRVIDADGSSEELIGEAKLPLDGLRLGRNQVQLSLSSHQRLHSMVFHVLAR